MTPEELDKIESRNLQGDGLWDDVEDLVAAVRSLRADLERTREALAASRERFDSFNDPSSAVPTLAPPRVIRGIDRYVALAADPSLSDEYIGMTFRAWLAAAVPTGEDRPEPSPKGEA